MVADTFITQLKTIFNDTSIPDASVEDLTDAVVDELNLHGLALANMAGSAGSKTITLTSAEKAAIRRIFRCIYASWYKNAAATASTSIGNVSLASSDLISQPEVQKMITQTATLLKQRTQSPPLLIINEYSDE
jgi:hypothetical protein